MMVQSQDSVIQQPNGVRSLQLPQVCATSPVFSLHIFLFDLFGLSVPATLRVQNVSYSPIFPFPRFFFPTLHMLVVDPIPTNKPR